MRDIFALLCAVLFAGCTSRIAVTPIRTAPPLADSCQPRFLEIDESPPGHALLLAHAEHSQGFDSECGKKHTRELLRQAACRHGADAVKIVAEHHPGEWRACYRVKAAFYRFGAKPSPTTSGEEKVRRLAELQTLREKGAVSEAEFQTLKEELLSGNAQ